MRVVFYIRRSHADSKRGISIELQHAELAAFSARQGWVQVAAPYVDDGRSAFEDKPHKRPAFRQLLADAHKRPRPFDIVLVYKYDRLARRTYIYFPVVQDFESRDILVRSATESSDWLARAFSGVIAEQYSRALSERMKDVRRFEAQQGRWVGPVPVGYRRENGYLVQNERIEAARLAGRLYATGDYGAHRITQALKEAGHTMPDGSPFKVTAIEEMLKCPAYAGLVSCGDQLYPGKHEAVWDTALWTRIQEVAQLRSRRRTKPPGRHEPLLAGLVYCAACGAAMWHNPRDGRRTYRCAVHNRQGDGPIPDLICIRRESPAEIVEATILAYLAGMALSGDLLLRARQLDQEPRRIGPNPVDIEQRLKRLARAYADGAYSDEEYEERRAALLALLSTPAPEPPVDSEAVFTLLTDIPTILSESTNAERRAIVRELLRGVWIKRDAVIAVRPTRLAQSLFLVAQREQEAVLQRGREWAGWAFGLNIPHSSLPRSIIGE